MADRREMNTDLMSSSGLDLDLDSRSFERPHDCDRVAAVDRRIDRCFTFDRTIDHCDVSLLDLAAREEFRQFRGRLASTREDHHAARRSVESMHEIDLAK